MSSAFPRVEFVTVALREHFINGALWSGLGRSVSMVGSFLITMVLARGLTPGEYGAYFLALNTIVILAGVGTLGMDEIVVRFSSATNVGGAGAYRVVGKCLAIAVAGGTVTAILMLVLGPWLFLQVLHSVDLSTQIGVVALWLVFAVVQRQSAESFRGLDDIRAATLFGGVRTSGILNTTLVLALVLSFWVAGSLNIASVLAAMAAASLVVVLVSGMILAKRHASAEPCSSNFGVRRALHEAWPLWIAGLVNIMNAMGGTWLAGAMDTADHVALFGLAQRFCLLLIMPMQVVNAVLPPIVARLYANGERERLERVVRTVSGSVLLPSVALFAVLTIVGRPLMGWLFGAYYQAAFPLLLIICGGQVVNIATGAWQIVMPMIGNRRLMLLTSVVAIATQAATGVWMGRQMGALGVAWGFAISLCASNLFGMFALRLNRGIWTFAAVDRRALRQGFDFLRGRVKGRSAAQAT